MLLNDMTRCLGVGCAERDDCERYRQRDTGGPRTPFMPTMVNSSGKCDYIILGNDNDDTLQETAS